MNAKLTRRQALKTSAILASGVYLGSSPRSATANSPNNKLNLAFIGVGGRGNANVNGCAKENLVALVDVDDERAAGAYNRYPKAKIFRDYRKMFDLFGNKLDGVIISTPDHTHFHPAYAAMQLGLHVYLEKPLAHNVWETRTLTNFAREQNLATQLGAQRHAIGNMHRVVELIKSNAIGPVTEVHSWVGGDRGMPDIPADQPAIPPSLDYDLWIGPARYRPYHPSFVPYGWRFWWDYGTGETGNWGCHILDIPFWALDLKYPTHVEARGPEVDGARTPRSMHVTYDFPANENQPSTKLHWYHGTPPIINMLNLSSNGNNTLFIGHSGMLLCGFGQHQLLPAEQFVDHQIPEPFIPDSPGFYQEWLAACRGEGPATCHFDYAGPLAETVLLGNVAFRAGGFDWDAESLTPVGNSSAAALIHNSYRLGWEI